MQIPIPNVKPKRTTYITFIYQMRQEIASNGVVVNLWIHRYKSNKTASNMSPLWFYQHDITILSLSLFVRNTIEYIMNLKHFWIFYYNSIGISISRNNNWENMMNEKEKWMKTWNIISSQTITSSLYNIRKSLAVSTIFKAVVAWYVVDKKLIILIKIILSYSFSKYYHQNWNYYCIIFSTCFVLICCYQ